RPQPEPFDGGYEAALQPESSACPGLPGRQGHPGIRLHPLSQGQQSSKGALRRSLATPLKGVAVLPRRPFRPESQSAQRGQRLQKDAVKQPLSEHSASNRRMERAAPQLSTSLGRITISTGAITQIVAQTAARCYGVRSEERRVGKECQCRWGRCREISRE